MVKSFRVISTSAVFLLLGWTVPADSRQEQQDKPKKQEKQQQQDRPAEKQQQPAKPARQDHPQANRQQDQQRQQQQQQAKGQQDQQRQQQRQQQGNAAKQQQQAKGQQDQQRQQQRQQQDNAAKQQQLAKQHQNQEHQQQQQQQAKKQQSQQQHQQQDNRSAYQRTPAQVHQQQVAWQGTRAHSWQSEHRTWQQRGGYRGYRVPEDRFRGYYGQDHGFRIYSLPVRYVGGHRRFHYGGYWFGLVDPWPEYWDTDWYDNDDVYVDYYGDGYYLYNRRYPSDRIAISFYLN